MKPDRSWANFVRAMDRAASDPRVRPQCLGLEGLDAAGHRRLGFYKVFVRLGRAWWEVNGRLAQRVRFDPVAYQERLLRSGASLPRTHLAMGDVGVLLQHPAAARRPSGHVLAQALSELADRWGSPLEQLSVSTIDR